MGEQVVMINLGAGFMVANVEGEHCGFLGLAAKCQHLAGSLLAGTGCVLAANHWRGELKSK